MKMIKLNIRPSFRGRFTIRNSTAGRSIEPYLLQQTQVAMEAAQLTACNLKIRDRQFPGSQRMTAQFKGGCAVVKFLGQEMDFCYGSWRDAEMPPLKSREKVFHVFVTREPEL